MTTVTVHCPRCHSDEVYRHGAAMTGAATPEKCRRRNT
ncbi:IS1 family transposase [Shigella sonnei]